MRPLGSGPTDPTRSACPNRCLVGFRSGQLGSRAPPGAQGAGAWTPEPKRERDALYGLVAALLRFGFEF